MAQVRKSRLDRPETVGGGLKGGGRAGSSVNNRTITKGAPKNKVSSNVTIAKGKANPGSVDQIKKQNASTASSASKAEAKTNARALKKAQGPSLASKAKQAEKAKRPENWVGRW